ncbi:glycosyltransferase [Roseiconus nitratireducens]|uniref:Glycosyltransferase n=1 Tax=Roseiconus nitratireducens TaxID=2605748 RepID=A0A5M6DIV3_9BACT|nr:glycosyltransferase [Roseiconus nitratireducens]KAA5546129.1 glycosyltransferase [Roseiconus nitratireducens]
MDSIGESFQVTTELGAVRHEQTTGCEGGDPLLSIVMAVHDGADYLPAAIDSILNQTFSQFEFLIVDDGSDSATKEILSQISDSRVQIITQSQQGLTRSLNTGLAKARGKYIARMDADDVAFPDRLERQFQYLEANPDVVALGTNVVYIDRDNRSLFMRRLPVNHDEIIKCQLSDWGGFLVHPSVMMRSQSVREIGGYDDSFRYAQDYDLWFRLADTGKLANLSSPLLYYRIHGKGLTQSRQNEQAQCREAILNRELAKRGYPTSIPLPDPYRIRINDARWMLKASARDGYVGTCLKSSARVIRSSIRDLALCPWLIGKCMFHSVFKTKL